MQDIIMGLILIAGLVLLLSGIAAGLFTGFAAQTFIRRMDNRDMK